MKKRVISALLTATCAVACAVGLTACGGKDNSGGEHTSHTYTDWTPVDGQTHSGTCSCGDATTENHTFENGVCVKCGKEHVHSVDSWTPVDADTHSGTCQATGAHTVTAPHNMENGVCLDCDYGAIQVESISFGKDETRLYKTQTEQLNVTVTPSNATHKEVVYTNTRPEIATVSDDGLITAVSNGSTVITATAHNGQTCSITVTVGNEDTHGLRFSLLGGTYTVSGVEFDASDETEFVIPATYNGVAVTAIGNSAFYYKRDIEKITLPDSVTKIGQRAFSGCEKLEQINIEKVTDFGDDAFEKCGKLDGVTLNPALTTIPAFMFADCVSLSGIEIPSTVTSIGASTFKGCASLEGISVPAGVSALSDSAFYGCLSLKTVDISHITAIGNHAFDGCTLLEAVELSSSLASIGEFAFKDCASLAKLTLPSTVTTVGQHAFRNSYSGALVLYVRFESGNAPSGFAANWKATDIPIVYDCDNNSVADDGFIHNVKDGGINYRVREATGGGYEAFVDRQPAALSGDIVLKSAVTYNGGEIPVKGMWTGAFNSTAIESVKFNGGITEITMSSFYGCKKLKSVDFGDAVTTIGTLAFAYCSALEKIELTDKIINIKNDPFIGCTGVTEVTVDANNAKYRAEGKRIIDKTDDSVVFDFSGDAA